MKLSKIFGIVLGLHIGVIGIVMIQPGCVSTKPEVKPSTSDTTTSVSSAGSSSITTPYSQSALNDALRTSLPPPRVDRPRLPPTRPVWKSLDTEELTGIEGEQLLLGTVVPAQEAVSSTKTVTYTVQKGDSLWAISKKFGVSLDELLVLNGLDKNTPLQIGQTIEVPQGATNVVLPSPHSKATTDVTADFLGEKGIEYTIKSGDSLSSIAKQYGTTVRTLKELNALTSDRIYAGQLLLVPNSSASVADAVLQSVFSEDNYAEVPTHIVKVGETPVTIAQKYGMSPSELMALNGIDDPRRLQIGQKLKVSSLTAAAPSATTGTTTSKASDPETPLAKEVVIRDDAVPMASTDSSEEELPEALNPFDASVEIPIIEIND